VSHCGEAGEGSVDGCLDVQPGGRENRDGAVRSADEQFDLGAAEDDPFGAGGDEPGDDLPVELPGFVADHAGNELRGRGVDIMPCLTGFADRTARFADGSSMIVDAVVWATGYRSDYSWQQVPGVTVDGEVRHDSGVTDVPGLYFVGLPWQTCRGSALLGFVGADAARLDARMAADTAQPKAHPAGTQPQFLDAAVR
jgi:hypothetical protein